MGKKYFALENNQKKGKKNDKKWVFFDSI